MSWMPALDVYGMYSLWYTAEIKKSQVCLWCQNCHHYHLRYSLNQCIAQLSACSVSNVQQTELAQNHSPVVVIITMAPSATRDFHTVSSKRIGEIVNSCIDDLETKPHTLKGYTFMHSLKESVFEACL